MPPEFPIVFAVYPRVTQLDFTGPYEVFARLRGARLVLASTTGQAIQADGGITFGNIVRLAGKARYVTSVCTGSTLLGAAGLLRGKRAACHWAWRDMLPIFGALADPGRVVRDGNVITGGGVTAGIDMALTVVGEIVGTDFAETVQLGLEYAPAPPFDAGRPERARPDIVAAVQQRLNASRDRREAAARRAEAWNKTQGHVA